MILNINMIQHIVENKNYHKTFHGKINMERILFQLIYNNIMQTAIHLQQYKWQCLENK